MTSDPIGGQRGRPATFVLVPGAGGSAWYWHRLVPELQRRGHEAVAVDLPADDDAAGLREYADAIVAEIGDRSPVVVVAQSMGGLSAPLACARAQVDLLVLVNAMIPLPGESGFEWWAATGQSRARADHAAVHGRQVGDGPDPLEDFLHDLPEAVLAEALRGDQRSQSDAPFRQPFPLAAWPDVPTRVLAARDDRFFPAAFQRRVALQRLSLAADEVPGGHLVALSRPAELADRLAAYWELPGAVAAEHNSPATPPASPSPDCATRG